MILSIILGIFTAWIIYTWGDLTLQLVPKIQRPESDHILKFIIGFCVLTFLSNSISLMAGLDNWLIQLLLLTPIFLFKYRIFQNKRSLSSIDTTTILLSTFGILIAVSMHAWEIKHPDTITYQNQLIMFAKSGCHPTGIVQIKEQLGLGGAYFSIAALFSYPIIFKKTLTVVNLALVSACMIYLSRTIGKAKSKRNPLIQIITLIIFALCAYEYTFFRLAVSSAAPDTPAAIVGLAAFIYHFNKKKRVWILTLFSATAVTLKLSLVPILLLPFFSILKYSNIRFWLVNLTIGSLILTPFFVKNILSTGYLAYPAPNTRIIHSNYTPERSEVKEIADYIKAYARTPSATREKNHLEKIANMRMEEWTPRWWMEMAWSGHAMVIASFVGICLMLWQIIRNKENKYEEISYLITTIVGITFWINLAPAIRFGSAFLLAPLLFFIQTERIKKMKTEQENLNRVANTLTNLFLMALMAYVSYRLIYFMDWPGIWMPKGPFI